jgi:predicted metal-dependent HD superfamily phosphohydrolase
MSLIAGKLTGRGGCKNVRVDDLLGAWHTLLARYTSAAEVDDAGRGLLARWSEPHRRYHDLAHLRAVLAAVTELADFAPDPDAVRLAAWYHDAVYAGSPDDEERSAQLAEHELAGLAVAEPLVAEVARLVRMTVEHNPAPQDGNGQVLSDADLAALALPPEQYRRNTAAIRDEYAHVPETDFRAGRTRVIASLLAAPFLFRTEAARQRWESAARANLTAELATLS